MTQASSKTVVTPSAGVRPARSAGAPTLEEYLFREGYAFDFFQAVRLLERLFPDKLPVARTGPPQNEIARFRSRVSLDFPASTVHLVHKSTETTPYTVMLVNFMGMMGPSGVLPRHYTELLLRQEREGKGAERYALRDWLDLFNHRLISLFFRAWEKYRFYIPFERKEFARKDPDAFTRCLLSLVGIGVPPLRNRLRVAIPDKKAGPTQERPLARIEDLALLRYTGFLSHRPRCASSLQTMLRSFLKLPVDVLQFQGQWFRLESTGQTSLGGGARNNAMGLNVVVGDRIWDVQGKVRIRLGPLNYEQFQNFLPDRSPIPQRKAVFLLAHLVRLYVGPDIDVEIQLILKKEDVPATKLGKPAKGLGARLGWNTWSKRKPLPKDADDPVFLAEERVWITAEPVPVV